MRVTVVRGGGVAGMAVTTTLDGADLDEAGAGELSGLVDACSFTDGPPSTIADGFSYEISVDRDGVVSRVRFPQEHAPPGAGALVGWVMDNPHATRTAGRPG